MRWGASRAFRPDSPPRIDPAGLRGARGPAPVGVAGLVNVQRHRGRRRPAEEETHQLQHICRTAHRRGEAEEKRLGVLWRGEPRRGRGVDRGARGVRRRRWVREIWAFFIRFSQVC